MRTARERNLAVCHTCMALNDPGRARCTRCEGRIHMRVPDGVQRTVACLLAACVLYVPANILPIMTTDQFGRSEGSTIIGGVIILWDMGSYPVALVILVASVLVPIGKMLSIGFLCWAVTRTHHMSQRQLTALYRVTEFIGKWSMVDVFVVAVLVALIQITGIMVVRPGSAALAFASVVILTMIAAEQFDSRLLWDRRTTNRGHREKVVHE